MNALCRLTLHPSPTGIELSMMRVFQPQRGGMFIGVEQRKVSSSVRSGMETGDVAPMGLFPSFVCPAINMPLLTELALPRFMEKVLRDSMFEFILAVPRHRRPIFPVGWR